MTGSPTLPPNPPTLFVFCTSSFGSMTVTAPLEAVGLVFLPAFQVACAWFTRPVPLTFEFTLSTTVSIVNVIVSSVALLVSVLTMSPRS